MQQRLILSEPVGSLRAWVWTQVRTAQRAQLKIHKIQSLGGNIRGARRGVLRQRLVTARPGRLETPARQALRPGYEELAARIRVMPETEARPRVKNRHGGAPRGERPASWDARRLASAWYAALWRTPRVFRRAPERLSALRPPLDSGLVKQGCKPRAQKRAAGTRWAV